MKIELYERVDGDFSWRVRAANGEIIIPPEGYKNKGDRAAIINKLRKGLPYAKIVEVDR